MLPLADFAATELWLFRAASEALEKRSRGPHSTIKRISGKEMPNHRDDNAERSFFWQAALFAATDALLVLLALLVRFSTVHRTLSPLARELVS